MSNTVSFGTPPFQRGGTFFAPTETPTSTGGAEHEGKEFWFADVDFSSTNEVKPLRTSQMVKCRVVRNKYAVANLLPKRLAHIKDAHPYGAYVDAYAITSAADNPQQGFPIDEYLPTAGVRENDLFYVVVDGPALVLRQIANTASDFAVGTSVVAVTAASSGATTAGRIGIIDLTGATDKLAGNIMNRIGVAMSTSLTSAGSADLLVNVGKWK